jgi:hypothetical protein
MTDHQRKIEQHEKANRECATLILKDPERYPPGCGLEVWARMVLGKLQVGAGAALKASA